MQTLEPRDKARVRLTAPGAAALGAAPAIGVARWTKATQAAAASSFASSVASGTSRARGSFCARVADRVWPWRGTEIAHWLFWHGKTTGVPNTAAAFMASRKSPCEVAPSPKQVIITPSSWR